MAENESLDLSSPHARRWDAVRDAAGKGAPWERVASLASKKLYDALRRVVKQFKRNNVTVGDFLRVRGAPRMSRDLLRKTQGHPYAESLISVLNSMPSSSETQCLEGWLRAVSERVFDQIGLKLLGTDHFPSTFECQRFFEQVSTKLEPDVKRIATRLVENPEWEPRRPSSRGVPKEDPTAEMLPMSVLGGPVR